MIRYLSIYTILCLLFSCGDKGNSGHISHVPDSVFEKAEKIGNQQNDTTAAIRYVDSVYAALPVISVKDKCEYYFFRENLLDFHRSQVYNSDMALKYIDSVIALIEDEDLKQKLANDYAKAFRIKGELFMEKKNFVQAVDAMTMCTYLSKQAGDSCQVGQNTATLGLLAYWQKQYRRAAELLKEAVSNLHRCDDESDRFYLLQGHLDNLALSYIKLNEYDSALKYLRIDSGYIRANFSLYKRDTLLPKEALLVVYSNLADVYRLMKLPQQSDVILQEISGIQKRYFNDSFAYATILAQRAELFAEQGDFKKADSLAAPIRITINKADSRYKGYWYGVAAKISYGLGDKDATIKNLELSKLYRDSFALKEKESLVANPETSYELIERRHQLELANRNNYIQRLYTISIGIGALLLVGFAVQVYRNLRRSKRMVREIRKTNEKLAQREEQLKQLLAEQDILRKKEKEDELLVQEMRLQMEYNDAISSQKKKISEDMHDELSSSLAALKYYVEDIAQGAENDIEKKNLQQVSEEVASIYRNARLYMHNLRAESMIGEHDPINFLSEISKKFNQRGLLSIKVDANAEMLQQSLSQVQLSELYHIIREVLSNVIKHSGAKHFDVKIYLSESTCRVILTDDGRGFDTASSFNGIGLKSIRNRAEELQGNLDIHSGTTGTQITLSFPIHPEP